MVTFGICPPLQSTFCWCGIPGSSLFSVIPKGFSSSSHFSSSFADVEFFTDVASLSEKGINPTLASISLLKSALKKSLMT